MSKILIISQSDFEFTTNDVCDWLNYYRIEYIRINVDKIYDVNHYEVTIDILNKNITLLDVKINQFIDLQNIKIVWCRRFINNVKNKILHENDLNHSTIQLADFISNEINRFLKVIYNLYPKWQWYDHPSFISNIDKIEVLKIANVIGLKIPKTYISNNAAVINSYVDEAFITKPIYESVGFSATNGIFATHTQVLKKANILNKQFIPSLIQEKIQKKYEIRIFYLDGETYTVAIFSSSNKRTSVDFRKYDFNKPNRMVPYILPSDIYEKLDTLMKKLNLSTASIDMIKSDDGYFFLEINPIGQLGMVSTCGNFYLEKIIAKFLIRKLNGKNYFK